MSLTPQKTSKTKDWFGETHTTPPIAYAGWRKSTHTAENQDLVRALNTYSSRILDGLFHSALDCSVACCTFVFFPLAGCPETPDALQAPPAYETGMQAIFSPAIFQYIDRKGCVATYFHVDIYYIYRFTHSTACLLVKVLTNC